MGEPFTEPLSGAPIVTPPPPVAPPVPSSDEFFGPKAKPTAGEFFGPPPVNTNELALGGAEMDEYFSQGSAGRILDLFGQGFKNGWGTEPLDIGPKTQQALRDAGVFNDYEKGRNSLLREFNERLLRGAAIGVNALMRVPGAILHGLYEAEPAIGGPLLAGAEAFPLGHVTGLPAAIPFGALERARDLGVIGKGEAGWKGFPTTAEAEAAQRLTPTGVESPSEPVVAPAAAEPAAAPPPDIHAAARQIAPDTFSEYDALSAQRDAYRAQLDEAGAARQEDPQAVALQGRIDEILGKVRGAEERLTKAAARRLQAAREQLDTFLRSDTPDMTAVRQSLQQTDVQMRDLAPDVSAAYRQAQERMPPVEEPAATFEVAKPAEVPTAEEAAVVEQQHSRDDYRTVVGGTYSLSPEDKQTLTAVIERTVAEKGTVTFEDLPREITDKLGTDQLLNLKNHLGNPDLVLDVLKGDTSRVAPSRATTEPTARAEPPAQTAGGAPIDDPLAMQERGELTAARAGEIRDELSGAAPDNIHDFVVAGINHEGQVIVGKKGQTHADLPGVDEDYPEMGFADSAGRYYSREEAAQAIRGGPTAATIAGKDLRGGLEGNVLNEAQRAAPDHLDPEIWTVIADNLAKAEASREGGVSVVADQMRYLPDDGVPKNISEREAVAVIACAIDAEAARGGDVRSFLAEADAAYRAAGHGTPPDVSAAEAARVAAPTATPAGPPIPGGIAGEVERRMLAAGRSPELARLMGALTQARYELRADAFGGAKGTAEDFFRASFPGLRQARGRSVPVLQGEMAQRGVTDTVKPDNAVESARTDQGQALPARVPTGKDAPADRHTNADAIPDLATLESNERLFKNTVDAVGADPGMGHNGGPPLNSGLPRQFASTKAKAEYLIGRLKDNLLWLYDQVPAAIRDRSRLWYDGAQAIATEWSARWGKTRSQTAGMLAVLSPQKDWFMNTSMAERLGDILHGAADHRWDQLMDAQAFKFLLGETTTSPANRAAYEAIKGKTLREVVAGGNLIETGMWLRAYDEAHHGAAHAIITPEGAYAGNVLTAAGDEARRAWSDFLPIGKAASIFFDGSPENISRQLGAEHKVRSFYNNIFNAEDPRHVTIDTHAVAADQLRPLAGKDKAVADNFGGTGEDNSTGLKGSYALHREAYVRAAEERGVLPREMQSITWEAVRGLFRDTWKTKANKEAVDSIWDRVGTGELSIEEARTQIHDLAGGIEPPTWVGQTAADHVARTSTYSAERGAPTGASITFEVAPDPRNKALVARWAAVPRAVQERISHTVAWQVAARAMEGAGEALWGVGGKQQRPVALKGELRRNNGAWLDDPNPSLSLHLDPNIPPAKAGVLARLLGYAFRQEEMLHASPKPFPGGEETGLAIVKLPADATPTQIHEVWQQIREIKDENGNPYALGHTTGADGNMVILNNNDRAATISRQDLAKQIAEKLGDQYDVEDGSLYAERVKAGRNNYGLSGKPDARANRGAPDQSSIRRAGNNLRRDAQQHLEEQLSAHEASTGGARAEPGTTAEPRPGGEPGTEPGAGPSTTGPPELEQARRGKIRLATDTKRAEVTFFEAADESTPLHEIGGHAWLEELMSDAADPLAPQWLRDDAATVRNWLKVEEGQPIPTRAHEKFARGFERFVMEGHAPSQALAEVFAKFRDWLIRIYETVEKLRAPITDEMRGVYGRLLASQREGPAVIAPEREMAPAGPKPGIAALDHLAELVGVDPRDYTPEQIVDMASGILSPEELARQIGGLEATAERHVAEAERRTGAIPESPAAEEVYGAEPETQEELERARQGQDAETPVAAGRPQGEGGAGAPGRPAGSEGVLPESAGARGASAEPAGRTSTRPSETPAAPNAAFGPSDERLIDKAGNIRLDNLNIPDDVEQAIRDAAERNNDFTTERRGVITDGQMLDLADALGREPGFIEQKKIGQAFNAEEILAARKLLVESATAVRDAMVRAAGGTDADVAAMAQAIIRHEMIQAKVAQATAEWGRAGRAFRALEGWKGARDLNQLLKDNTGRTLNQLRQMAELGQSLTTPAQVSKLVADAAGGLRQAIIYYWVNTLISGPITHMTYSVGNAINALWTPLIETPLAATSGAVRQALGIGAADRVHFNEVTSQLYGLGKGFRDGLSAAYEAYKSGVSPPLPGERIPAQFLTPLQPPIPGLVGRAIGVPGQAVSAIHSFFKTLRYEQNIQALAMRDALEQGLEGNARDLHVARLTANPTEEMMASAVADALKELYMRRQPYNSPGALLAKLTNSFLPLKIIAPFVKIGSEIVRNAFIERTPLGLGSGEVRANLALREGGAAFDQQLGKIMAGTGLMAAVTIGVLEGNITGDGPSDPNERRIWLLSHKPNTISVGPLSFSYARLGHLGMLTRFAANMTETSQRWNDEDGAHLARSFFDGITRSVLDETWMRGVKDMFDAMYHMEEHFDSWVTRFVAQWTPYSIGLGQVARTIDPYQRETRDLSTAQEILNQFKSHTPWYSQTLPYRRDTFGEPITTGSGTVDRYAQDKVTLAMNDLHIGVAQPERKIRGVPLTAQQYDDYARIGGRMAKMELDAIVGPGFSTLPPETRIKIIKETLTHAREAAAAQIMMQSLGTPDDIIKRAVDSKAAAAQGASPLEVKEKLKAR